jgi:hypothetical protein
LAWRISRKSLVWVGPESHSDIYSDFCRVFQADLKSDGDIFANLDSDENVLLQYKSLAQSRGLYLNPKTTISEVDIKTLLTPSAKVRFDRYHKEFRARPFEFQLQAYIADISQDPSFRNRSGQIFGALTKSSMHYSLT